MGKRSLMYLHLFHGRDNPRQEMDNWGFDGPVLRVYGCHVVYGTVAIALHETEDKWHHLTDVDGCLYYNGQYFGDWSIFAPSVDEHPLMDRAEDVDVKKLEPMESQTR